MQTFKHINATTVSEAVSSLASGKAVVIAGGTDLLGRMKDEVLPNYPETLVNLKTIPNMDSIKEETGMLKIGAMALLADIAGNTTVKTKYTALAQAAGAAASTHIREMGTIGGNICQLTRCWYLRSPHNRFYCTRKGGNTCFALLGDNRYHSIFGVVNGCLAVNPGDIAPVLVAMDAKIVTSSRTIKAEEFWDARVPGSTVLDVSEIVTEIQIPVPASGTKSSFVKFALRKTIDFPIVNCAVAVSAGTYRICLNAVYNKPYRATAAESAMSGKAIDESSATAAGEAAVAQKMVMGSSGYKVQIAKTLVKRALLACR